MPTINKTGDWIYIIKEIPVEVPVDKLSIWYAKPTGQQLQFSRTQAGIADLANQVMSYISTDKFTVKDYQEAIWKKLNGKDLTPSYLNDDIEFAISRQNYTLDNFESTVEIITPFGPVTIHPEEFNKVSLDWALRLVEEESHVIRYLNNDGSIRDNMKNVAVSDKVFYLETRGISFTQAMKMVSGEIKTQHLMYFDPLPQYIQTFSRTFIRDAEKKMEYCKKEGYEQLLQYPEFHLQEYLDYLTEPTTKP